MTEIAPTESAAQCVKKSISLPDELLGKAIKRARKQQRSFSSYVQSLIAGDLREQTAGEAEESQAPR